MKRFVLLWLCLCMAYAVHADGGATSAGQRLQIVKAADGKLIALPDYVYLDPQNSLIHVESNFPLTCKAAGIEVQSLQGPALSCPLGRGSDGPKLTFTVQDTKDPARDSASVKVISPGRERSPLLYCGLVLLFWLIGLSMGRGMGIDDLLTTAREPQWWNKKFLETRAPAQEIGLQSLPQELEKLKQALSAKPVPSGPAPVSELERRITTFLGAAENWSVETGGFPEHAQPRLEQVKNLRQKAARKESKGEFYEAAITIVRMLAGYYDDHHDRQHENLRLQAAIVQMAEAAGLELINPSRGQKFLESEHKLAGSEHSPTPAETGLIARTVRRGMKNSQSVICKAEVLIFD
jgi:hypothetical protein